MQLADAGLAGDGQVKGRGAPQLQLQVAIHQAAAQLYIHQWFHVGAGELEVDISAGNVEVG